jgi:hypothetical protein
MKRDMNLIRWRRLAIEEKGSEFPIPRARLL